MRFAGHVRAVVSSRAISASEGSNPIPKVVDGTVQGSDCVVLPIIFNQLERGEAKAVVLLEAPKFEAAFSRCCAPDQGDQGGAPRGIREVTTVLVCIAA